MSNELFNQEDSQPAQETPKQEEQAATPEHEGGSQHQETDTSSFDQLLSGIQSNDGRQKYGSVEDALKALPHAQKHISTLEDENRQLQERMQNYEEQLKKMEQYEQLLAKQSSQSGQNDNSGSQIDEATIAKHVEQYYTQAEQKRQKEQNGQQVVNSLQEMFGSREAAAEAFAKKADELEVDQQFLTSLAQRSPKAVLSYFNTTSKSSTPSKTQGDVNTTNFQSKPAEKASKLYGNTSDLVSNWRISAEQVKEKLGQS